MLPHSQMRLFKSSRSTAADAFGRGRSGLRDTRKAGPGQGGGTGEEVARSGGREDGNSRGLGRAWRRSGRLMPRFQAGENQWVAVIAEAGSKLQQRLCSG